MGKMFVSEFMRVKNCLGSHLRTDLGFPNYPKIDKDIVYVHMCFSLQTNMNPKHHFEREVTIKALYFYNSDYTFLKRTSVRVTSFKLPK